MFDFSLFVTNFDFSLLVTDIVPIGRHGLLSHSNVEAGLLGFVLDEDLSGSLVIE